MQETSHIQNQITIVDIKNLLDFSGKNWPGQYVIRNICNVTLYLSG